MQEIVSALITLDSPHGWKNSSQWLTGSQYYQPKLVRVPVLDLRREDQRFDLSVFQTFKYSNRFLATLPGIMHSDFTSFPMIALNFKTNMLGRTPAAAAKAYQAICSSIILLFLERALKSKTLNEEIFPEVPQNVMKTQFLKAQEAPPTEEEFVRLIKKEGYEKALLRFRTFKEKDPDASAEQKESLKENALQKLKELG